MKKIYNDGLNTIDSHYWAHKGYEVWKNANPTGHQLVGNKVWVNNYRVFRPGEETPAFDCHSLSEAKEAIEDDLN